MWVKDFANAEIILGEIVNTGGLDLEDLSILYHPDLPVNREIIFSINYERLSEFCFPYVDYFLPYRSPPGSIFSNVPNDVVGNGFCLIEHYVMDKFSPEDKRLEFIDSLVFEYGGRIDTNIYTLKYVDRSTIFSSGTLLSGSNVIVLRYADVLLMYAEALNENGKTPQAYPHINRVRERAGLGELPPGYARDQMFQALADERQKEFIMEGDRWFDLVFRGLPFLKTVMNSYFPNSYADINRLSSVRDNCLLFPIPESQLQIKPVLTQNPDY